MPSKITWQTRRHVGYSITAWEINRAYYFDGFFPVVIEGSAEDWEVFVCKQGVWSGFW